MSARVTLSRGTIRATGALAPAVLVAVLGAALIAGLALPSVVEAKHRKANPPTEFTGFNGQGIFPRLSIWQPHLDAMRGTGVRLVRYDARWDQIEPEAPVGGRHDYRWRHYDAVAGSLARQGLRWLPILTYSPAWAGEVPTTFRTPPRDPADFAAFARDFAARYGRGGSFWKLHPDLPYLPVTAYEIWNEPNGHYFWRPGPDPAQYADLYMAAREAIHALDGHAQVLVGGLVYPGSWHFLRGILAHRPDASGRLDGVALHPYGMRDDSIAQVIRRIAHLRYTLQIYGQRPRIWITEVGWTTQGPANHPHFVPLTESERAARLSALLWRLGTSDCGVRRVLPHTWVTPEEHSSNVEDWFGVANPRTAALYPSALAYGRAARQLRAVDRPGYRVPQRHRCGWRIARWRRVSGS